jgi:hypothetical protein
MLGAVLVLDNCCREYSASFDDVNLSALVLDYFSLRLSAGGGGQQRAGGNAASALGAAVGIIHSGPFAKLISGEGDDPLRAGRHAAAAAGTAYNGQDRRLSWHRRTAPAASIP